MPRNLRRILLVVLAVLVLGGLGYKFRNSITLQGFQWSMVGESLRNANIAASTACGRDDLRVLCDPRAALDEILALDGTIEFLERLLGHSLGF